MKVAKSLSELTYNNVNTGRLLEEYMSKDEKLKFQQELEEATKKIGRKE